MALRLGARNKSDDHWVLHSLEVRAQLTRLLSLVQSGETGQRGYLLTGRDIYLRPYLLAGEQLSALLDHTETLVSDNPQHVREMEHLRQLIKEKFDELKNTVDAYQAGHNDAALAIVNNDHGYRLMQEIRELIETMQTEEDQLLAARQSAAARSGMLLQAGVAIAFLLICGLGYLIARFTRGILCGGNERKRTAHGHKSAIDRTGDRREAAESQLRQAQKMEALGQLTGGIAHDFNNMLGVIMGALDLVTRRIAKGDFGIQRFLDAATAASERAATLTQRLLAFARQQPLSPQPLDANQMIGNMSELLHSTLGEQIQNSDGEGRRLVDRTCGSATTRKRDPQYRH